MILPSQKTLDEAYVKDYEKLYAEVKQDPEAFWENIAHELSWFKPWNKVLDWKFPYARWFVGGQCNIVNNAIDRHLKTDTKDKLVYIWHGQDNTVRTFTYAQLNEEVSKLANGLKSLGIKKGDKVSIYLPRIPEQIFSMLACAKIGAVHLVVFSGFSADALKTRIVDAEAKLLITCDGYPYGKKFIELKKNADNAVISADTHSERPWEVRSGASTPTEEKNAVSSEKYFIEHMIVVKRGGNPVEMTPDRDVWYHELLAKQDTLCHTEIMEATDPLFILYTSGTTGKPKGIIHAHGGYMVGTYLTLKWVFNLQKDDVYFCTADAGWITGHSYIVYGPLINGVTTFIYEGTPDFPDPGIWWKLVEQYKITKFYTAPTAIRALMRVGEEWPNKYDLSSLKILGSVGEPINPEAWNWYYKYIGREQCPIMDTWWQTETGMHMLTPIPSAPLKPGSAFKPFFGVEADLVDDKGISVPPNTEGFLIIKTPWPSMFLDVYKNPEKYKESYFNKIKNTSEDTHFERLGIPPDIQGRVPTEMKNAVSSEQINKFSDFIYFTGDSAKRDEDGYYWIIGRNDDVIKVSGHRLGSAEIESAFVADPKVAEAAAIGKPHDIKGESIKVFVILKKDIIGSEDLKTELKMMVRKMIGPIATPDEIEFVDKLPKTRSGKIMRRVLKAQELGQPVGDTSTLES